jgi:hypothetical protein
MDLTLPKGVPESEFCFQFVGKMINAMGLSFFKYGRVADAYPSRVDAIASLKIRLQKYEETGNAEFLVDVSNFAMIEFKHPRHPLAHYKAEDSGGPGRAWTNGHVGETANTAGQENVRLGGSKLTTAGGFYRHEGD